MKSVKRCRIIVSIVTLITIVAVVSSVIAYKCYRFINYEGIDGILLFSSDNYEDYQALTVSVIDEQKKNGFISKIHYFDGMDQLGFKFFFQKERFDENFFSEVSLSIADEDGNILIDNLAGATSPDNFLNYTYINVHSPIALEKGKIYKLSIFRKSSESQNIETAEKYIIVKFKI